MVGVCSPADRGHMSKVDGPESLAISICDVSYKLINLKIILLLIHCLVDMPTSQHYYCTAMLNGPLTYNVLSYEY